jgi:tetratricopeptide (TPR) repeat protein
MSDTSFDTMMNSSNGASGSLFYAEGWGLTHMLFLSPDYAANLPKLVAAFQGGHTTAEALPLAFDRTPEAIYGDLQSYWKRNTLEARVFSEKMDPTEVPVTVAPTTDFESSLMLVDLLAVMNKENGDAKPAFENLEKKFDAFEQIQNAPQDRATTLATMYFHVAKLGWGAEPADSKRLDKLERILDLPQVKNAPASRAASAAEMYYFFALLEREAKQPKDKVTAAFLQALQLQPDFQEARVKLGETYLYFNDAANARSAFVQVAPGSELAAAALNGLRGVAGAYMETAKFDEARAVAEESRPWVRTAGEQSLLDTIFLYVGERTSNASLQTGNLKEARAALESVRKLAKTPADIRDLDRLDGLITARSKGRLAARPGEKLLRADGTAQALDCPVSGALLRVLVGDKEMSFDLPDPAAVEVLSGSADLHCGKLQGFHIVVEYAPPGVASKASAGIVRRMAF